MNDENKKQEVTPEMIRAVASFNASKGRRNVMNKYYNPESPDYDPDYFKKIRKGEKINKK